MAIKIRPKRNKNRYRRNVELKQAKTNKKNAFKYKTEIERAYNRALREVQTEIDSWYMQFAANEEISLADAKRRLTTRDIEEWHELVRDYKAGNRSDEALDRLKLLNVRARINRLEYLKGKIGLKLIEHSDRMYLYFEETLTHEAYKEMARQEKIFGDFTGVNFDYRIRAIVGRSFYGARWTDRIWIYNDELQNQLEHILTRCLILGENAKSHKFIKEIQSTFNMSRYQTTRLLVTEMARCQTDAQQFSFEKNGYEYYQFICCGGGAGTNPNDPCEACRELDGKVFRVKDMKPGKNAAPIHNFCHCSVAAWWGDPPDE